MQLIKRYIKGFVSVICVIALLASCVVFPASAAQIETENNTGLLHYDLLFAEDYYFLLNDREFESDYPAYYINPALGISDVQLIWSYRHSGNFNKLIFAFNATQKPSSVLFNGNPLTYIDCISYPSSGDVYFYSYTSSNMVLGSDFDISFNFDSAYSGVIGVYSCVGLFDTAQPINNVDVYREDYFLVTEGYEFTEANPVKNKKLPYTFSKFDEESGYFKSQFRFIVDSDDFVSPLVDRASFLFTTCCTSIAHHVTLISKDSNGLDVNNLKYNLSEFFEWGTSGDYFQGYGEFEAYKTFQIDVDLSGFDMSKYDLMVSVGVNSITETNGFEPCYADLSLRSISYIPFVENEPWYKTFFGPLFNGIRSAISSVGDFVSSFWDSVTGNFNHLFEKLEEYFGDDGSLAQAGEQMSEQAGQMNEANDALNSVEKPSLDTGGMFDSLLDFDTGGLAILSCMTSNVYVTQLLVVVFTFALCSYVFFGKRG